MQSNFLRLITLFLLLPLISFSQQESGEKRIYNTKRIEGPAPNIDGLIDNDIWDIVEWSGDFTERYPNDGVDPSQETAFKVLYDDNFLYVLIRAYDTEPDKIVKRMSRRDGFDGDWVELGIDSYFDQRTAFSFTASVSGVKGDRAVSGDGNNMDRTWDPIWTLKTSSDQEGWIAEMRIPLTQLRFSNHKENQVWGIQVRRHFFREDENSFWAYFTKDETGWVRHFGELHGIKNIKPRRQAEISPYIVVKQANFESEDGNPYKEDGVDRSLGFGIDGKLGITNDFTLDFTINPDFGQVEADPSEVNLSAFESYFAEKRPFFIENRNITDFRVSRGGPFGMNNLFYSRRIGRSPQHYASPGNNEVEDRPDNTTIWGAMKLTGKTKNGLSVGVIESLGSKEETEIYNTIDKTTRNVTVEPLTNYLITRVQKDLNNNNTIIGGMFTATNRFINDKDSIDYLNRDAYTGGIDFTQYFKDKKYALILKYGMSHIQGDSLAIITQQESSRRYFQRPDNDYKSFDPSRTSLTGTSGLIQFRKQNHNKFNWGGWVTWHSPEFEINDVGYQQRSDAIFQVLYVGYNWTEPFGIFRYIGGEIDQWSSWDFGLNNSFHGLSANIFMQFKNHWSFGGGGNVEGDAYSNTALRGGPALKVPGGGSFFMHLGTDERKKIQLMGFTSMNWGFENSNQGKSYGIDIVYRPWDALKISLMPDLSISSNEMQYLGYEEYNGENRYIFSQIDRITTDLTLRIDYTISPDLTIQFYGSPFISSGDYSDVKYIIDPKADKLKDRYSTDMTWSTEDYETGYDFNFKQFRANLVARWEYRPGSLLYFVWSPSMTGYDDTTGRFNLGDDLGELFGNTPLHSVLLIKASFRIAN